LCNFGSGSGEDSRLAQIFCISFYIWAALACFYGFALIKLSHYNDLDEVKKKSTKGTIRAGRKVE